jgi:flavin-dependent dehydrogenase
VLVGDAFAFLDPVFSSGVYLALRSGVLAGDAAHDALALGDVSSRAFESYSDRLCHEIESMRGLVFAFYDRAFSFGSLIKAHPELRSDLTECLIGNLNRDFSELFAAVGELAALPGPLPYGRPLVRKGA